MADFYITVVVNADSKLNALGKVKRKLDADIVGMSVENPYELLDKYEKKLGL